MMFKHAAAPGRSLLAVLAAACIIAWGDEVRADGFGPFPVRNFQPFQLLTLGMFGERAEVVPEGVVDVRLEMAETSVLFREETGQISATVKFEQLRSAVFLRYGLTNRLEVAIEVPAFYRYPGFLEGAIEATERATTGLSPARKALKGTGFAFNLSRDGRILFQGGSGELGLGDITLTSKYQVRSETTTSPALAARFAVKVPSGDDRRFFGSGHADVGVGLALGKTVLSRWVIHTNLNAVFPTGKVAGLSLHPALSSIVALEYLWSPGFSVTAQFDYYSSPFRNTGSEVLDNGVTEATVGFSYLLREHLLWQVYGVENLDFITGSAADFTLSTVVTYRFGT